MKKTILKVLASMLVLAMAITALVIPSNSASAATKQTKITLVFAAPSNLDRVLLDIENQNAGITVDATSENKIGWGRNQYIFTKESDTRYSITLNGTIGNSNWCNIQFLLVNSSNTVISGHKYYPQDGRDTFLNNDNLYFSLNTSSNWATYTASTTDPEAATADEVIAEINKIGTVTLSDTSKALIDAARAMYDAYSGNASDITNYATLTAAEAEWDRLCAAAAGELTLHVKTSWTTPKLYGWDSDGEKTLGDWPGTLIPADELNDGWFTTTITLTEPGNLIINNGAASNTQQTSDWKYVSAGEVWVVMDGTNYTPSRTVPAGWITEAGEDPAPTPETTYHVLGLGGDTDWSNTDANKMTLSDGLYVYKKTLAAGDYKFKVHSSTDTWFPSGGDVTFTVETECEVTFTFNAENGEIKYDGEGLKEEEPVETYTIKVQIPEGWTNPCWYAWDADNNNAGAWPGKALGTAVEGWYTIEVPVTMTNLIINADGGVQTKDIKNLNSAKDAWIVVTGTGDDGFTVTYEAPATGDFSNLIPVLLVLFGGAMVLVASKKRFA